MHGFKSFADKTVLEFMPGITTVIGPNGSGKSNISDCIRWVLGEQSMKSLRGAKSEDIIFAGTQNRKSLGYAEASIVIDNSDSKLPIEYNEVIVTRRIYRIVKYRTRKVESERKLEQVKLNLLRINDIISEIENNIGPLKIQSEKAKKFLDLRENLKTIEVGLFLYNIENYKKQTQEILENIDIFETQKVKEEEDLNAIQLEKENLRTLVESLIEEIEKTQNLGFEGNRRKEQYNSEIAIFSEKISNNKENYERYAGEIEDLENRNKELEEEKNQKIQKRDNLFNNKEKFETELKEKEEELAKYSETLSNKELEIEEKKKIVQENTDNKYQIISNINTEKANFDNLNKRENLLKSEIQENISELDASRTSKEELDKNFYEVEKKRNEFSKLLENMKSEKNQSSEKLRDYETKINAYQSEYRIKQKKKKKDI